MKGNLLLSSSCAERKDNILDTAILNLGDVIASKHAENLTPASAVTIVTTAKNIQ